MSDRMDQAMARLAAIAAIQAYERDRRRAVDMVERWLNEERAKAWHEGYGHGREDQAEETRTGQMHVTLNPHELPKEPGA